jgi:hypothetical protein
MKPGRDKAKQIAALVLMAIAIYMVIRVYRSSERRASQVAAAAETSASSATAAELADPRLHLDLLHSAETVEYHGTGKNIFREEAEIKIPAVKVPPLKNPKLPAQAMPPAPPPGPPPPPPINLVFFGYSTSQGEAPKAFLSEGGNVWIAHEGDVVNRHYKIVRITPNEIEVEDLLNNNRQHIRRTPGAG